MEQEPGNTCPLNLQHTPFFFGQRYMNYVLVLMLQRMCL